MRPEGRDQAPVLKLRPAMSQRLWGLIGPLAAALGMLAAWIGGGHLMPGTLLLVVANGAIASCLSVLLTRNFGVDLTPESIRVRGLRRRTIAWSSIRGIRTERRGGLRGIVLCECDGRRTRLPAPISGFLRWDRRFERKLRTIERHWTEANGLEPRDAVPIR
jgi:hypothetical protein